MKIELKDKQLEILFNIAKTKEAIAKEYERLSKQESDIIEVIAASNDVVLSKETQVKLDGKFLVFNEADGTTEVIEEIEVENE